MIIACFIIFAAVLCYLIYNFNVDYKAQHQFILLSEGITFEDTAENGVEKLNETNPDCIGWLRIKDTKIDYPVMQTQHNPQYYLHRNYNKEYSYIGTPFMDSRCDIERDVNFIIYGHNMRDGAMFGDLMKYKKAEYCLQHQKINLLLDGKNQEYTLYAVVKTTSDDEWYTFTSRRTLESVDKLIEHIKEKAVFVSPKEYEYGDSFITLSTCEYSQPEGRLLIIARRTNDVQEKEN